MKGKKTGGRQKGTPNKTSAITKAGLAELLHAYMNGNPDSDNDEERQGLMLSDFMTLKPKDRLYIAKDLMPFVLPKLQSVDLNDQREVTKTIEDRLLELSQPVKKP